MSLYFNSLNYLQQAQRYKHIIDGIYSNIQSVMSRIDSDPFQAVTLAQELIMSIKQVQDVKSKVGTLDNLKGNLTVLYNIPDPTQFLTDAEHIVNTLLPDALSFIQFHSSSADYSLNFSTGSGQLSNIPETVMTDLKEKLAVILSIY